MSFHAELCARLQKEGKVTSENGLRRLVSACGGYCGKIQKSGKSFMIPIHDSQEDALADREPVDFVYLWEENQESVLDESPKTG